MLRRIDSQPKKEQKRWFEEQDLKPVRTSFRTDFMKDRVAVEIQFSGYTSFAHDLFFKHYGLFVSDVIDVGIEILPMEILDKEMSRGGAYFEKSVGNLICQVRGRPAVPLVVIGIEP